MAASKYIDNEGALREVSRNSCLTPAHDASLCAFVSSCGLEAVPTRLIHGECIHGEVSTNPAHMLSCFVHVSL